MKSRVFSITKPRKIEGSERNVKARAGEVVLRPVYTGICKSDINYFEGARPPGVLKNAYPVVPFHEAVAEVLDGDARGERVVPIPNMPCGKNACHACRPGGRGSNYCPVSRFASSNAEGFARTVFAYPAAYTVRVPKGMKLAVACLVEPLSIAMHAADEMGLEPGTKVCVLGDGPLGLAQSLVARYKGVRKEDNYVIGLVAEKLAAAEAYAVPVASGDVPKGLESSFDVVFECVGDKTQGRVLDEAVTLLRPGGRLAILGLSDGAQPLHIRPLMKKGITAKGLMRSDKKHFWRTMDMLGKEFYGRQAARLIGGVYRVENEKDVRRAFSNRFETGKTLLDWRPMESDRR